MLTEDCEFAVTSSGYTAPMIGPEGAEHDLQDIVIFNFSDACDEHPKLKHRFFRLGAFPPDCFSDAIVAVLNYGYPSMDQVNELDEKKHIGSLRRSTTLKPYGQPHDPTLLHLKPLKELSFDPDGLSGGPNFVVQSSNDDFQVYFAGITVRAGKHDLYLVKSGFIRRLLDASIDLRA
ncbi:hypothetical protein [Palleronia salina]|uniref:hypothetical protein n=1 Tax=Palleronia salina TaxID=313368 RepID=UPI001114FF12|nr:hypothetical protein [Palleronia salina]